MARGGHHGGSFHSGGHHGGGHHGGGFGGGFGGGGRHHYGSYGGGGGDSETALILDFIVPAIGIVLAIFYGLQTYFNCFDFIKVVMLVASAAMLFFAKKKSGNTAAITILRSSKQCYASGIYNNYYLSGSQGKSDGVSWYTDKDFCLVLDNRDSRQANIDFVYEELKKWPFILKIDSIIWYISSVLLFILNIFFYQLVIPLAENSRMSDEAFAFVDDLIYYLPVILILLCAVACLVINIVRIKMARKMCIHLVDSNVAEKLIGDTEKEIELIYETFWYFNICPYCGLDPKPADERCRGCGSSLEVKDLKKTKEDQRHKIEKPKVVEK